MTLDESARLYLADYYLLDQARKGANKFLEDVAQSFAVAVQEQLKKNGDGPVVFGTWVQKGGGNVEFYVKKHSFPELDHLGDWKYAVIYRDAMRTETLSDTTKCRIYGFTPKGNSAQANELIRMAKTLGLPNPYESNEFELLNGPFDSVVDNLTRVFVGYLDNYVTILQALAEESRG